MSESYPFEPDWIVTPGEVIQDCLERCGMTQADFADRLGKSLKHVNKIINGKTSITMPMSVLISRVLGGEPDYWLRLQQLYDREKIRLEEDITQYKLLLEAEPIICLVNRGYIDYKSGRDTVEKGLDNVLRFFSVSSVPILRKMTPNNVKLRRSEKVEGDPLALACWLRCGEIEGMKVECQDYSVSKFQKALHKIRSMIDDATAENFKAIQRLCAECGVALVAVKEFKDCATNGAAQWLSQKKALIMLNFRGVYADSFWFSFFHEAGHILKGSKKRQYINGWMSYKEHDKKQLRIEEREADEFARSILIPKKYDPELPNLKTSQQITEFAAKIGIHPGVIVGRLQHDGKIKNGMFDELRVEIPCAELV